ncbi:MAG: glycosyltransferase family 39 protein, partial [Acidimicrobiales bacterium]
MSTSILHGHMSAFYWGQSYGGAESYVVAAVSVVLGKSAVAMSATAAILAALASVACYFCAKSLCGDRLVAVLAATAVWAWPEEAVWHSTTEFGFRGVTLLCGLLCLAFALRIDARRESLLVVLGLGLAAGVGWWSSPEIVYFLVPAGLILLFGKTGVARRSNRHTGLSARAVLALAAFLVGALPWLVANISSGFASLKASSTGVPPSEQTSYLFRVGVFFKHALPQQLGLINPIRQGVVPLTGDGKWVLGTHFGPVSYVVVLVLIVAMMLAGLAAGGVARLMVLGLIAFPFIYAIPLSTFFWEDGRYGPYLPVIVVVTTVAVVGELAPKRESSFGRSEAQGPRAAIQWLGSLAVIVAVFFGALGLHQVFGTAGFGPTKLASNWGNPEDALNATVDSMTSHGITVAWSGYWIANVLDEVSDGRVQVGVVGVVRQVSLQKAALNDPRAAWIFFPAQNNLPAVQALQATAPGPLNWSLPTFEALLKGKGIGYSTEEIGVLVALRPDIPVTPATLGISPSLVGG